MKWLLLIFIFQIDDAGNVGPPMVARKLYDTEAECNLMGKNLRDVVPIPEGVKSFSVCVGPDDLRPEK